MTDDEWGIIEGVLEECWAREWTERTGSAYRLLLDEFSFPAVLEALKHLGVGDFRPSAGTLRARLLADPGRPTWAEVMQAVFGRRGILDHRTERECLETAEAEFHPFIAGFVSTKGVETLKMLGIYDDDWGQARQEQLRKEWVAYEEIAKEREQRGLPLVTGGRTKALGRMKPLALLGLDNERPELEAGDP